MTKIKKLGAAVVGTLAASAVFMAQAQQAVRFPDPKTSYLKTGAFIGPDHVERIKPGMNKDQVRLELGNPHFSEGLFGVTEWDYVFNFYTGNGKAYKTCQFKVRYDSGNGGYRVASTHWKDPDCANFGKPPPPPPPVVAIAAPVAPPRPQKTTLQADNLFRFNGGEAADLLPEGREKIAELAAMLRADAATIREIVVIGHTDRLGSDAYNEQLSLTRAQTVAAALAGHGLDPAQIRAVGMGERNPVVTDCKGNTATPALVRCLQPNRRVEVELVRMM